MHYGSQAMSATLRRVLMRRPGASLMAADAGEWHYGDGFDAACAIAQYDAFAGLVAAGGAEIIWIKDGGDGMADAMFTHDPSLMTDQGAVLLRMGKPGRMGEPALHAAAYRDAGIPIAGGHSIDVLEPIYGLVALGVVDPARVKRNAGAQPGDRLILGKPLGVGVLSAALKKGRLDAAGYAEMIRYTTQLNTPGPTLAALDGVNAVTDVTGFGLAGHLLEICRGSGLSARVAFDRIPLIEAAAGFAREGIVTGASGRNWAGYCEQVHLAPGIQDWQQKLLTDPQTSGGLLVSCAPHAVPAVLACFADAGFERAAEIGELGTGTVSLAVA